MGRAGNLLSSRCYPLPPLHPPARQLLQPLQDIRTVKTYRALAMGTLPPWHSRKVATKEQGFKGTQAANTLLWREGPQHRPGIYFPSII